MIALLLFAGVSDAETACDSTALAAAIGRAETAFTAMDSTGFDGAMVDARASFDCQTDPLTPILCADYHRVLGLDAFLRDDGPDAVLAFHAALNTTPGYDLPTTIAPAGHPLRTQFEQAKLVAPGGTFDLAPPQEGWLSVDGQRTETAPAGRPFVLQRLDDGGNVVETLYVELGAPIPQYPVAGGGKVASNGTGKKKRSGVLIGTGIALGVASAAMYGAAFVTRADYDQAVIDGNVDTIEGAHTATNGLVIGSIGALAVGATFVIVGL
jgi:hypothetical protein